MKTRTNVAIIGGGPSGLAAAITAKRINPELSVLLLEKKEQTGKKLRATGNGRCNISNVACPFPEMVIGFFMSVGIAVRKDDSGRLYPYSEDGGEVTEVLTANALGEGVELALNTSVSKVEAGPEGGFLLYVSGKGAGECIHADRVLIATGGKSYAALGTTGDGYIMARQLGHKVTPLAPSLTGIETVEDLSDLKGVRTKGSVSLFKNGDLIFKEDGEIQFRQDGISGICVMDLSQHVRPDWLFGEDGKRTASYSAYQIRLNLVPDFGSLELLNLLRSRSMLKGYRVCDMLKTLVKGPLAEEVIDRAYLDADQPACLLEDDQILNLANQLRSFQLEISGLKGWNEAQVTAGGVAESEVDPDTMESKRVPGLYFSGEVLEYAGPCGGYNLHHAWMTGILAGENIAYSFLEK